MVLACHLVTVVTVMQPTVVIGAYLTALLLGHLTNSWSPISHGGNFSPESCFFSWSFNFCAAIYVLMALLRYVQISQAITSAQFSEKKTSRMRLRNRVSFVMGSAGSCGISMVGSFQQRHFKVIHYIGAFSSFFWTIIYFILDTYFCYALDTLHEPLPVKLIRLIVVIICLVIMVVNPILEVYFLVNFNDAPRNATHVKVHTNISTTSEWIIFFLYQLFLASFWPDLSKVSLEADKITFVHYDN